MLSKIERIEFINKIKLQLELCNYGFQMTNNISSAKNINNNINENNVDDIITIEKIKNMKSIRQLFIIMNLYIETGNKYEGNIDYQEANRIINYRFDDKSIKKCKLNLLVKK